MGRTGFEPVTSSVSGMGDSSDSVARRRVTAARHDSAVAVRRLVADYAWRGCHLVSHWLSGPLLHDCVGVSWTAGWSGPPAKVGLPIAACLISCSPLHALTAWPGRFDYIIGRPTASPPSGAAAKRERIGQSSVLHSIPWTPQSGGRERFTKVSWQPSRAEFSSASIIAPPPESPDEANESDMLEPVAIFPITKVSQRQWSADDDSEDECEYSND